MQFGRELNATDDRDAFVPYSGSASARPVLEGKQIGPFRVFPERSRLELPAGSPTSNRDPASRPAGLQRRRERHEPAHADRSHRPRARRHDPYPVCLKTPLPIDAQHVLCALLNSFVANYLVRLRVNTHVTASLLSRVPVPVVTTGERVFERLAALSRTLASSAAGGRRSAEYAEQQAIVARLYHLTPKTSRTSWGRFRSWRRRRVENLSPVQQHSMNTNHRDTEAQRLSRCMTDYTQI